MMNKIILGHALTELPKLPAGSVSCVTCSPPYWGLRDYGIDPVIWDGDKEFYSESLKKYIPLNCKHEWGNKAITLKHKSGETNPGKEGWFKDKGASDDKGNCFCLKCGAWRGSLGLEPTFDLYIKHLCNIFDEVKRVLRKDGTCWVNLGDSYASGKGTCYNPGGGENSLEKKKKEKYGVYPLNRGNKSDLNKMGVQPKSLCLIPQRFAIEMVNRGWILRNTLIWHKPNCMPSSAPDRFTVDFEYLFFFTKNNKAIFWTNEKTLECVSKNPPGTKGIEGKDWEWRPCPRCQGTGGVTKIDKENAESMGSPRARYHRITKQEECKRCKGLGKIKVSFWSGHDYWFEQQFEEHKEPWRSKPKTEYVESHGPKEKVGAVNMMGDISHREYNPQGRNKRAVWTIPTQPFPEAHFAVYPKGLIEIPIRAGCPEFVCRKCGKARVKIYEYKGGTIGKSWHNHSKDLEEGMHQSLGGLDKQGDKPYQRVDVGYSDCGCGAGWESGIVCDPFMGAGTSALVALKQRKKFIGIEIKQEYIDMSKKRIAKVQQRIF